MTLSERTWYALEVGIEPQAREAVEYALMEAGALGTETNDSQPSFLSVTAYFDHVPNREHIRAELIDALRIYDLPSSSVHEINVREVADKDWLGEWKKSWRPVEIGRFIIAPSWTEIAEADERFVIRIEPGMAFGTGTHETTRLCLTAIEKYFGGESFLDVGTGTGVLAIAAAKLFPAARIEACDTDPNAIAIARENAGLNGVLERMKFRIGSVDNSTASADLVCANLTADIIVSILPSLLSATCGRLILSGILNSQIEGVMTQLLEAGITEPVEFTADGEWATLII